MKSKWIVVLLVLFAAFSYAAAADFKTIRAEELKRMIDKRTKMTVVDARTPQEYREGHIPSSINIPPEKLGAINTILPKDKDALVVFYCRGVG